MEGLCAVRPGSRDPVQSFRMFLLPEGKSVRVPNCTGKSITLDGATWSSIKFPCWVRFKPGTKRKDELA
eukprot:2649859-Pleurochrysis_carterae.AAC.1